MAINNKDCFLKGFLVGQDLKLHKGGSGSGGGSASSGTSYDKASFLSGLAAGMASVGVHKGLSGSCFCVLARDAVHVRIKFGSSSHGPTIVSWGDGTREVFPKNGAVSGELAFSHTYSDANLHMLSIREPSEYMVRFNPRTGLNIGDGYGVVQVVSPFPQNINPHLIGGFGSDSQFFQNNRDLQRIPEDLFAHINLSFVGSAFANCNSLQEIPPGLFKGNKGTSTFPGEAFGTVFSGCTSLTSIPAGLFDQCTEAENFQGCFSGCSGLTSIPAGLFDHCPNATTFVITFSGCTNLTSIPAGLFDNCPNADYFSRCFYNCTNLSGTAPPLWERSGARGDGCFYNCTGLSNYADIPSDWKKRM